MHTRIREPDCTKASLFVSTETAINQSMRGARSFGQVLWSRSCVIKLIESSAVHGQFDVSTSAERWSIDPISMLFFLGNRSNRDATRRYLCYLRHTYRMNSQKVEFEQLRASMTLRNVTKFAQRKNVPPVVTGVKRCKRWKPMIIRLQPMPSGTTSNRDENSIHRRLYIFFFFFVCSSIILESISRITKRIPLKTLHVIFFSFRIFSFSATFIPQFDRIYKSRLDNSTGIQLFFPPSPFARRPHRKVSRESRATWILNPPTFSGSSIDWHRTSSFAIQSGKF